MKVSDLKLERWPLLRSSINMLERLVADLERLGERTSAVPTPTSNPLLDLLQAAAVFNLAQMRARLYYPNRSAESLSLKSAALEDLDHLEKMPALQSEEKIFRDIRQGKEDPAAVTKIALPFKLYILQDSIRARDFYSSNFRSALDRFQQLEFKILKLREEKFSNNNVTRFLRRVTDDLLADFYTKSGYMAMERALDCPDDIAIESPDRELNHAERFLLQAIELTPGRTSAKMYLARVYCAQAGAASGLADIAQRKTEEIAEGSLGESDDIQSLSNLMAEADKSRKESVEKRRKSEELYAQLQGTAEYSAFHSVLEKAAGKTEVVAEAQDIKPDESDLSV